MKRVFLGGTCNGSKWREELIKSLAIDYFNPVVEDWNEECQKREIEERETCDFCLYCITPLMRGVYSIAEVVDDSNKRPEKTVFVLLRDDFSSGLEWVPHGDLGSGCDFRFQDDVWKSLSAVYKMVETNGATVFYDLDDAARYLNTA